MHEFYLPQSVPLDLSPNRVPQLQRELGSNGGNMYWPMLQRRSMLLVLVP